MRGCAGSQTPRVEVEQRRTHGVGVVTRNRDAALPDLAGLAHLVRAGLVVPRQHFLGGQARHEALELAGRVRHRVGAFELLRIVAAALEAAADRRLDLVILQAHRLGRAVQLHECRVQVCRRHVRVAAQTECGLV